MSNVLTIQYYRFEDLDDQGIPTGESTYGFTAADNYATEYNNTFDSFDELVETCNESNLMDVFLSLPDSFGDISPDTISGVFFNGRIIPLKDIFSEYTE